MNKREKMYQKIEKHGEELLAIFPNATIKDPIRLCKRLRTLETKADNATTKLCNGVAPTLEEFLEKQLEHVEGSVIKLLGIEPDSNIFFINRDPRGYALKIRDEYMREINKPLHKDCGGYGILAPDFSEQ